MPTTHPASIRQATTHDAEIIAHFNIELCRETEGKELDPHTVLKGVTRFIDVPSRGYYFVAEQGDQIVGQTAITYEWSDWRNGELWWIQSVYVLPRHRGQGVFKALLNHVKQQGETDRHCCGIRLYMERDNHTARRSYLKLGFVETGYEVFESLL